jgi:hypothetical protein
MLLKTPHIGILLLGYILLSSFTHKFYVSICDIDYNDKNESLEIAIKLIAHDVERTLEEQGIPKLRLASEKEHENTDKVLSHYIKNHFEVQVNEVVYEFSFVGKEIENNEDLWCYLEVKGVKHPELVSITNTLLTDMFSEQSNIVNVNVNGKRMSMTLTKDKPTQSVAFK